MHLALNVFRQRSWLCARGALTLLGGAALGCAAEVGPSDDALGSPSNEHALVPAPAHTYVIELGGQHKITYSVYEDGVLSISEVGSVADDKPVGEGLQGLSPAAAFRALHPGTAVPKDLQDAEAFFAPVMAEEGAIESDRPFVEPHAESPEAKLVPKAITSDPNTFLNIFGCFFGSGDVLDICLTNRGQWANAVGSSRWAIYKTAPYVGNVTVNIFVNGIVRSVYQVSQGNFNWNWTRGQLRTHTRGSNPFVEKEKKTYPDVATHQYTLSDAANSQFHFSVRLHNYQMWSAKCAEISSWDSSRWIKVSSNETDCPVSHYGP